MFQIFEGLSHGFLSGIKERFEEVIKDTKEQIREAVERAVKKTIMAMLMLIGVLFALVGIAKYLSETVPSLSNGLGFVVVGLILLFLGIMVRVLSTN